MADQDSSIRRGIRLADVGPFPLGELQVVPATRQLLRNGRSEILEPRVMQVLVALAEAKGAVISRDELINRCWNGVIVGENAIQRTISRIRHAAATIGNGSFELETITKVGYRIIASHGEASITPIEHVGASPSGVSRRLFVAGSAATTVIAAASLYIRFPPSRGIGNDPAIAEARVLYEKGLAIREGGRPAQTEQALAYFRQATQLAPAMAEAWGGLAYGYADAAAWSSSADWPALAERSRSAAQRALSLDSDDPDARAALVYLAPMYRNWLNTEPILRQVLRKHPDHRRANGLLAQLLGEVGRWRDAIPHYQKITGPDDFIALARYGFVHALWSAGRLEEAQSALDAAAARWPTHPAIWELRVKFPGFTGRPDAALALLADKAARPTEAPPWFDGLDAIVRAVRNNDSAERAGVAKLWLNYVRRHSDESGFAVEYLAALGALDDAFAMANGFYLGRGPWARTAIPTNRFFGWVTSILFGPLTAPMRADPRFLPLVRNIGLETYWRQSRSQPDYRAAG